MNPLRKLRALFCKGKLDRDMAEEMRFHLNQCAADHVADGVPLEEARYAAKRKFGNVGVIQEAARDQRGWTWLEHFLQDVRYAVRTLGRSPQQTAIAIGTLALGIGLVVIQASVVSGVRRGLPFQDADQIVWVLPLDKSGRVQDPALSDFFAWRETQKSFPRLAALGGTSLEISGANLSARSYRGAAFSSGLVEMLGVQPVLGRAFTAQDERQDAPPVLLLRQRVWQNDFGGDPDIVGRVVRLRGEPATIIGVLPDGFGFPENEHVWVNLRTASSSGRNRPGAHATARMIGRLQDDVAPESAAAEFDVLVRRKESGAAPLPEAASLTRARVRPVLDPDGGKVGIVALSLLGVVGGVLVLAGLNIANLLSARALQRGPELALRSALGANRGRLLRQLLTESMLIALLGAAGGILLSAWGVPVINREFARIPDKPFWFVVELDQQVLAFAIIITALVGVLSGLFPALRATRRNSLDALKDSAAGGGSSHGLGRINRGLVVVQLTLSSAVLIVTGVLVNAVWRASQIGVSFDAATVLSAELRLSTADFSEPSARVKFFDELLQRMRALPGVTNATLTDRYPVERSGHYPLIQLSGRDGERSEVGPAVSDAVAEGFFRDLQIPLREGREFVASDGLQSERVAVVNESLARMAWPGESAVGKQFRPVTTTGAEPWLTVVGVVADLVSDRTPRASAVYHVPLRQSMPTRVLLYLRSHGDVSLLVRPMREVVHTLSPDIPLDRIMSLKARMDERITPVRIFSALGLAFGISGLFLAAVGVYGVTAFMVQRRGREFGIRLALGAKPSDLLGAVFKQGARQLVIGLGFGLLLGWAASMPAGGAVRSIAGPMGLLVYVIVLAAIAAAVSLALWIPARRAARVDPMIALRCE